MINNYQNFLLETVSMKVDVIIDIIKTLKGNENKELVDKLINYADKNGKTVLMSIVQSNNQELINYILKYNVDLQAIDNYGRNVLFYCKNMKIFKKFYDLKVNVKAYDKKLEKTILLHLAIRNLFNVEIYEQIIREGVNINKKDKYNNNLLVYSILNKNIVNLLIKNNIDFSDTKTQKNIMIQLFSTFRYHKNKRTLVINIFKILFDNGIKFNTHKFAENISDTDIYYGEKTDVINTFIKPLLKYFNDEILISTFKHHISNKSSDVAKNFAKNLLNLGIYPELYHYLKNFYGEFGFNEIFKDYIKKHPYLNDVEKYNL